MDEPGDIDQDVDVGPLAADRVTLRRTEHIETRRFYAGLLPLERLQTRQIDVSRDNARAFAAAITRSRFIVT